MKKLVKINGKIANQPVVVPLMNHLAVLVLVKTDNGFQKFCCTTYSTMLEGHNEISLTHKKLTDIALSSFGDEVELFFAPDKYGLPTSNIQSFKNLTKKLGRFC